MNCRKSSPETSTYSPFLQEGRQQVKALFGCMLCWDDLHLAYSLTRAALSAFWAVLPSLVLADSC